VPIIISEETAPEISPKVSMVFFISIRFLWIELKMSLPKFPGARC
jgi:hypothetical protein